jgi:hypothetical protein
LKTPCRGYFAKKETARKTKRREETDETNREGRSASRSVYRRFKTRRLMREEKRVVRVSGKEVAYLLKLNDRQKNIILRVKNDAIYVSAPTFATIEAIEMMIRQHYPKISRAQLGFELNQKYDLFTLNP